MATFARLYMLVALLWASLALAASTSYLAKYDKLPVDMVNSTVTGRKYIIMPPNPYQGLYYRGTSLQSSLLQATGLKAHSEPNTLIINIFSTFKTSARMFVPEGSTFTLHSLYMGCEIDLFPVKIPVDCAVTATVTRADNSVASYTLKWKARDQMTYYALPVSVFGNARKVRWTWQKKPADKSVQPQFDDVSYTIYTL